MGFKLRSGNTTPFKQMGSSPIRKEVKLPRFVEKDDLDFWEEEGATKEDVAANNAVVDKINAKRKSDKRAKELEKLRKKRAANPREVTNQAKNWWEEGYGQETTTETKTKDKYDSEGNLLEPEKNDYFSGLRPLQQALGLSKEQRAARKEKKAKKLADAKSAVGSGSETFKQAKLVDKANRKADRKAKRDVKKTKKDKKKLAKYRKKNPVRGKEAINAFANQTKKDKKLKDRYGTGADAAKKAGKTGDEPTGLEA
jgi:hypothetical protein